MAMSGGCSTATGGCTGLNNPSPHTIRFCSAPTLAGLCCCAARRARQKCGRCTGCRRSLSGGRRSSSSSDSSSDSSTCGCNLCLLVQWVHTQHKPCNCTRAARAGLPQQSPQMVQCHQLAQPPKGKKNVTQAGRCAIVCWPHVVAFRPYIGSSPATLRSHSKTRREMQVWGPSRTQEGSQPRHRDSTPSRRTICEGGG